MISKNKNQFIKEYYLTLILSHMHELSDGLILKGGTCLNKIL